MTVAVIYWLVIVGLAVWVGIDSSNLGMQRGRLGGGFVDMGVATWVVCCLLIWFVALPCYFVARSRYKRMYAAGGGQPYYPVGQPYPAAVGYGTAPALMQVGTPVQAATHSAPPQLSPDGHWWWDGQQWIPASSRPPANY